MMMRRGAGDHIVTSSYSLVVVVVDGGALSRSIAHGGLLDAVVVGVSN